MERLMLWIARNKNTTPKPTIDVVFDDDMSSWEIIDPSHDERPGFVHSGKELGTNEQPLEGNVATKSDDPILTVPDMPLFDPRSGIVADHRDVLIESLVGVCDDQVGQRCRSDEYHQRSRSNDDDDGNDEEDDDDIDYSYDDDRFGNQRMGKVGKKVNRGMMKKSKKLPRYYYNKMAYA